jgi:hypothetical protein
MRRLSLMCASALLIGSAAFADDSAQAPQARPDQAPQARPDQAPQAKLQAPQAKSAQSAGKAPAGDVAMSGMSILGNDEAPKSLVLVPWKSSQLGDMPALSRLPDDSIKPVDKDVFARELSYYQIRSDSK